MFSALTSFTKHCPSSLVTLARSVQSRGEILRASVETACLVARSNEVVAAISAISFLRIVVSSADVLSAKEKELSHQVPAVSAVNDVMRVIRTDAVLGLLSQVCGIAPWDVLEPLAVLLYAILARSQWQDVEASINAALCPSRFKLGDDAKAVVHGMLRKSMTRGCPISKFGYALLDVWKMHQTDDMGSIAGGEAVSDFAHAYG